MHATKKRPEACQRDTGNIARVTHTHTYTHEQESTRANTHAHKCARTHSNKRNWAVRVASTEQAAMCRRARAEELHKPNPRVTLIRALYANAYRPHERQNCATRATRELGVYESKKPQNTHLNVDLLWQALANVNLIADAGVAICAGFSCARRASSAAPRASRTS